MCARLDPSLTLALELGPPRDGGDDGGDGYDGDDDDDGYDGGDGRRVLLSKVAVMYGVPCLAGGGGRSLMPR